MTQKVKGVYSTKGAARGASVGVGPGRSAPQKRLWLVFEHDENYVNVQPVNKNLVLYGQKRLVAVYEFENDFTPEPQFGVEGEGSSVRPVWRAQQEPEAKARDDTAPLENVADLPFAEHGQDAPDMGNPLADAESMELDDDSFEELFIDEEEDVPPASGPAPQAPASRPEPQPKQAKPPEAPPQDKVRLDLEALERLERDARSSFGLGLSHLKRGNKERALSLFEDVAAMEGDFEPEHKHMFNEFGINLRKSGLPDVALKHYRRALSLSPKDENLHHNIARIYWELNDMEGCERELLKSLELNPQLKYSEHFLRFLRRRRRKRGLFHGLLPRMKGKRGTRK